MGLFIVLGPLIACVLAAVFFVIAALLVVYSPRPGTALIAATVASNQANLRAVGVALQKYHSDHGVFPPAYLADESGVPMTSWRAMLLPYVQEGGLEHRYQYDKPWDAPENTIVRSTGVTNFSSALNASPLETNCLLLTGKGALFDADKVARLDRLPSRALDRIAIAVQVQHSGIEWSEPKDLPVRNIPTMLRSGQLSNSRGMVTVLYGDGIVREITLQQALRILPSQAMAAHDEPPLPTSQ